MVTLENKSPYRFHFKNLQKTRQSKKKDNSEEEHKSIKPKQNTIKKIRSWFFENTSKTDKLLARSTKREGEN